MSTDLTLYFEDYFKIVAELRKCTIVFLNAQ
jgi:hypothetical protein